LGSFRKDKTKKKRAKTQDRLAPQVGQKLAAFICKE
jgi:hypothetical protein